MFFKTLRQSAIWQVTRYWRHCHNTPPCWRHT